MVEAVQEEASHGVGQPCPTDCVKEREFDMVIVEVLEEQVRIQAMVVEQSIFLSHKVIEDEASKATVDEDWHGESGMECIPCEGPTTEGMLEKQVGLVLQEEVPLKDRLPKVGVMLLMDMLLKVSLHRFLYGLQSCLDEGSAMSSSK
ncbi:hypothetical protein GOP47_0015150 [Adiantum capillus-veneris]|uniref:Uncharacterized protein n=1 Tax=Adiantum capillus-veneris TaxID=13818 RepID=A0A9D4ZE65_ADICA|nr:hypothetical protein GOP47_0015150 [Adiantum capillus-veneris]